jgi:hypothetical protein
LGEESPHEQSRGQGGRYRGICRQSQVQYTVELISAFNNFCLTIKEKRSAEEIHDLSLKLNDVFDADFPILACLLPKVEVVLSGRLSESSTGMEDQIMGNLRAVCFMLQRFFRLISSAAYPVMVRSAVMLDICFVILICCQHAFHQLFIDDLQWCDQSSSLTVMNGRDTF